MMPSHLPSQICQRAMGLVATTCIWHSSMSRASVPHASQRVERPSKPVMTLNVYVSKICVNPRAVPSSWITIGKPTTAASNNAAMTRNSRNRNAAFQVKPGDSEQSLHQ